MPTAFAFAASPRPRPRATPLGWFARAGAALRSAAAAQARREMLALAERCDASQPQLAAELRAASVRHAIE